MSISPHRAHSDQLPSATEENFPVYEGYQPEPQFDQLSWAAAQDEDEVASAGGRLVLGWALGLLATLVALYGMVRLRRRLPARTATRKK